MSSRQLLCVLGFLLVVSTAAPRAAHAQTTKLFFDSQPGDYIGGGTVHNHDAVDATFTATSSGGATSISVIGPDYDFWWYLDFKAAGAAGPLAPGTYETARRYPFYNSLNALDVAGDGRGCNALTGRFVVLEAVYDSAGAVLRFAADFEQHCEDAVPALFGSIRYNSTISNTVPFGGVYPLYRLTVTPPLHGTVTGDGLTCGTGGSVCVAEHSPTAATVSLDATPDPGYVFAGWGRDCQGGPHATVKINMQKTCAVAFVPVVPVQPRSIAVLLALPSYTSSVLTSVSSPTVNTWTLASYGTGFSLKIDDIRLQPDSNTFQIQPPTDQSFQAGVEYQTASFPDATHAGFNASTYSLGVGSCSGPGTMAVREWVAGPGGVPTKFSIDFRLDCSGPMVGTLQYAGTYQYGQLAVNPRDLRFKGVADQRGLLNHSADQPFQITPSGPQSSSWELKSDQAWLTASPATGATALTATAKIRNVSSFFEAGTHTAHLQAFARGLINIPEPVTVTLDVVSPDNTSRPFAVFRPAGGGWFMPGQGAQQFGLPGDIPLAGDFDGDGTPDIALYRPWTGEWFTLGQPARQWGGPGDIPVPADYNGDGITDMAVFRQSGPSGLWYIFGDPAPRVWGARGDIPVPGDYDGDGVADLAIFRPATGAWHIQRSATGQTVLGALGQAGDIPVVADFDGDRKIDFAVFRPSTGFWYITLSAGGTYSRQFGLPGDIPVPLDVTGDGRAELRLWRPASGTWYSYDRTFSQTTSQSYGLPGDVPVMARPMLAGSRPADLDGDRRADVTIFRPSTGEWFARQSSTAYGTFTVQPLGAAGDIPVPGDYDGDRLANPAVYRPSTGEWFVRRFDGTMLQRAWGLIDDVPVPADYDGDGRIDMAVYRPSSGEWFILSSSSGYASYWTLGWGLPGDRPTPADFDGDGRADAAVYRPSTGEWFVAASAGAYLTRQWGLSGDVPIARDFDADGRADLAVFRPSTGEWFVLDPIAGTLVLTRQWGLNGDVPAADDYDGDGAADLAIYRPATSEWFVRPSSGAAPFVLQWGLAADVPVTRH